MNKTYEDGRTIFSEGDQGLTAYVIVSGEVDLTKAGPDGPVHIATLSKGELFGEMAALDRSPRSTSAIARGQVTLHAIGRDEFLDRVTNDPDMALRVMTKLVERLRAADERLARREAGRAEVADHAAHEAKSAKRSEEKARRAEARDDGDGQGLLARLFGARRAPPKPAAAPKAAPPVKPLAVALPPWPGDDGNRVRDALAEALGGIDGLRVATPRKAPAPPPEPDVGRATAALIEAARLQTVKDGVDLMVVGGLDADGAALVLWLVGPEAEPADRPGAAPAALPLPLPPPDGGTPPDPGWIGLAASVVTATLTPRSEGQARRLGRMLAESAETVAQLADGARPGLPAQAGTALTLHVADVLATAGLLAGDGGGWLEHAIDHYRSCLRGSDPAAPEWTMAQRLMGLALQTLAEHQDDPDLLDWAAEAYRAALSNTRPQTAPRTWGRLNNRLGQVLYRIDLARVSEQALKDSLNAFRNALKVVDKTETPLAWAEIMNNLSQSLQLYGEHTGAAEVIERAVDTARAALDACAEDAAPALRAAIHNNLGSALFLAAKHADGDGDRLTQAIDAFAAALSLYQKLDSPRLAAIAAKNRDKAETMARSIRPAPNVAPEPGWAKDGEPPHT